MNAIVITEPGDAEVLQRRQRPQPTISENQVLIRIKAAGINRLDIYQRQGKYPAPAGAPKDIPGVEVAGIIESKGANVVQWKLGDQVCALVGGGGYADYVQVEAGHCLPIPSKFSFTEAASLPEAIFTVWSNVFIGGQLLPGERCLVHGGSSGIGMAAIQLASAQESIVYATAGSESKCNACVSIGARMCINYKEQNFEEVLKDLGIDVILDMVGGDYFQKNINLLNPGGRLIYINAMKGRRVTLDILQMMRKRIIITGSTLRSRDDHFKNDLAKEIKEKVWPLLQNGNYRPVIDRVFDMSEASEAHRHMESSQHIGKIVLTN